MNRIKCLRVEKGLSQTAFGKLLNVDQTAVSNWETGKNNIDIKIIEKISNQFSVPMDFVYGKNFLLKRPIDEWHPSEREDYANAPDVIKDYLLFKFGRGYFETHEDVPSIKTKKPADDGEFPENVIIYHRDGKTVTRKFTKEQMDMLTSMIEAIPEKTKDI